MDWDYMEDQDDGYMHPNDTFRNYFIVDLQDDCVNIHFFTHNGGYPSSIRRIDIEDIGDYLHTTLYERFGLPLGFNPDDIAHDVLEAMKNSRGV